MLPDVAVIVPGATKVEGIEKVTVEEDAVVVISLVVPARVITPSVGVAVPVPPASSRTAPVPEVRRAQVASPPPTAVRI